MTKKKGKSLEELDALLRAGTRKWNRFRRGHPGPLNLAHVSLVGYELEGANFNHVDFSGSDLSSARLSRASFLGACLRNARLRNTQLRNVNLAGANMIGANCTYVDLRGSSLQEAIFDAPQLIGLRPENLVHLIKNVDSWNELMKQNPGFRPTLHGADFSNSCLDGVNLFFADLMGCKFADASLARANFRRCNLKNACFDWAYLDEADLTKCALEGATFHRSELGNLKVDSSEIMRLIMLQANQAHDFRDPEVPKIDEVMEFDEEVLDFLDEGPALGEEIEPELAKETAGSEEEPADSGDDTLPETDPDLAAVGTDLPSKEELAALIRRDVHEWNAFPTEHHDMRLDLSGSDFANASLNGIDLRDCDLSHCDFSSAQMRGANLQAAKLTKSRLFRANLQNTNLQDAQLRWAVLTAAKMEKSNLMGAQLSGCKLDHASVVEANLQETVLRKCVLTKLSFRGAHIKDTVFDEVDLDQTPLKPQHLRNAKIRTASFSNPEFLGKLEEDVLLMFGTPSDEWNLMRQSFPNYRPDFTDAFLENKALNWKNYDAIDFSRATLIDMTFTEVSFTSSRWVEAEIRGCRFDKTDFRLVEMSQCTFVNCHFFDCKFEDGTLQACELKNTHLTGCRFPQTNLGESKFVNCILKECQFVGNELEHAVFDVSLIKSSSFADTDMRKARFPQCDFSQLDMQGAIFDQEALIGLDHDALHQIMNNPGSWEAFMEKYPHFQPTEEPT